MVFWAKFGVVVVALGGIQRLEEAQIREPREGNMNRFKGRDGFRGIASIDVGNRQRMHFQLNVWHEEMALKYLFQIYSLQQLITKLQLLIVTIQREYAHCIPYFTRSFHDRSYKWWFLSWPTLSLFILGKEENTLHQKLEGVDDVPFQGPFFQAFSSFLDFKSQLGSQHPIKDMFFLLSQPKSIRF